jgi:hypothetical protein
METMDWASIIIQAVAIFAAFKVGQWSIIVPMRSLMAKIARRHNLDLEQVLEQALKDELQALAAEEETPKDERAVTVERVGNSYYAYGAEGEFLAQGQDFRSMFEIIKVRFPNMNFHVARTMTTLTEEESQRMIATVFEVFGDKDDKTRKAQ